MMTSEGTSSGGSLCLVLRFANTVYLVESREGSTRKGWMFKAAVVTTKESFSKNTGLDLGTDLVEKLGRPPSACWLFCSPKQGIKDLLAGIQEAISTDFLVGCTTDGEISSEGFSTGSAVLGGITTDEVVFHLASVSGISQDSEAAGRELGRLLPSTVRYVQIFSDGLTGNGCAMLRGLSSVLGNAVPVCGGTAGDAGRFQETFQFIGADLLTDSVVGIGFSGDFSLGTGVRSGWSPIGIAKKVTRAEGNVVRELNGQPALEVYERFLGKHADKLPSVGVEYPLGLTHLQEHPRDDPFLVLRATISVNREEGSITFAGEVPEGSMVRLTCGDHASILEATEKAARLALQGLDGG